MNPLEPKSEDGHAEAAQPLMRFGTTLIVFLSLVWLVTVGGCRVREFQPTEYQIKAACLFNFAKFVEWPPAAFSGARSPIVIGILGKNPFHDDLARTIRNKTVDDHPLVIKEFRWPTEATNCHILFISASEKKRLQKTLGVLKGTSVLTVSETAHFTETGGMINFVQQGTKIRFQINNEAATRAGLKISSKLLSLAWQPGS